MRPALQRRVQRYGWDYSSPYYETGWQQQLWPAQKRLLEKINFNRGDNVLDISCGTGLVTFPIVEAVGPEGSVTGIDLSEGMIDKATSLADKESVSNVSFQRMDAEKLDLSDDSFDVAVNSLGLMYYPDPDKAIREMYRVVKPEGRAATLVWGRRNKCGWNEIFPIVDRRVESDVCPLFFQLGTGETLQKTFKKAGFTDIASERFDMTLHFDSDEQAVIAAFLGGAVALAYRKFDDQTKEEAHAEYLESIGPYRDETGYDIPGEFVIVFGRKG
ncbi:Ubiquinone/menaquinone biosynthesis C-methylase UbiE [Fodinibius roseus]|uniref:Ubiquinone/menaquinone biosynthesis C-methylase UbiE n=1 Tax=Fodinibius roseus TaxID=1194090 RepID=A0A1M5CSA1_9BACT|nr:methyltransferase domain-containing protein [Fodinibius roseus]SHF57601.1 Ubiquinone/menaquinone biosynthesis C-methylase UbiE [Fodinibius roseus]